MRTINLIIEYYTSGNSERQAELDYCLRHNLGNCNIDRIFLFFNGNECNVKHSKVFPVNITGRLRYSDFFLFVKNGDFTSSDIFILANSDIHFDNSLRLLNSVDLTRRAICLTRYENNRLHKCPKESQDVWIINKAHIPEQLIALSGFTLGVPGCDNRIAYLLKENGLEPYNPCIDIKCYHIHASNHRTYQAADTVQGPYLLVSHSRI